jgi:ADP-ribose pyrophosphatase
VNDDVEHLRETRLTRTTIHRGRIVTLHDDIVRLASGREGHREVVEHRGAVGVVATDSAGALVLVRQWRHPLERALWELPAGTLEPDEQPDAAARRELEEETGYSARTWRELGRCATTPGFSNEVMVFYRAEDLTQGAPHPDEDELLDVQLFTPDQVSSLVHRGEVDMKTIAGVALAGMGLRV